MVDRQKWNAKNSSRQQSILRILEEKACNFTELHSKLGWGKQTLNLYLKELLHKSWVTREKRGRKVIYSLIDYNSEVQEMLRGRPVIIKGRVQLNSLDEGEYIREWIHTLTFALLNIIKDYLALGKNPQDDVKINRYIEAHISDLAEVTKYHGELMTKMIGTGTLDNNRMWKAVDKLQLGIMKDRSN